MDIASTKAVADDLGGAHEKFRKGLRPNLHRRYLSIDILRATAILLMIQVHFSDEMSAAIASPMWLYQTSQILGLIPAPFFTFLSGLSYALWLHAQNRSGGNEADIVKYSFRRGMFVFIMGMAVNLFIWLPTSTYNWDVLTLLGASAIVLTWVRNWHPLTLFIISIVILFITPPLRDLAHYQSFWLEEGFQYDFDLSDVLLGFFLNGYFPILPWLIYPFIGFAVGRVFDSHDHEEPWLPDYVPFVGGAMITIALLAVTLEPYVPEWLSRYYINEWPEDFYPATTVFILLTLGGTLLCFWALNNVFDFNEQITGSGPVLSFFRRFSYFALTAYVVHLAATAWPMWIGALWERKIPTSFYSGQFVGTPIALSFAAGFIILFYFCLVWLDRHRKYSLEYFMRWCCD